MTTAEFAFFRLTLVLYALGFLIYLIATIFGKGWLNRWGTVSVIIGALSHILFTISRWVAQGHAPIVNLFELVCGGSLFAVLIMLIAYRATRSILSGLIVLPIAFLMMGAVFFTNTNLSIMTQALNSFWLYIHVLFALIAYGCFLCAAGFAWVYLTKSRGHLNYEDALLIKIDNINYKLVLMGFVCTAIFVAAGAVWAYYAWGRYWGWDPVETASLLTWLIYGLYLHLRTNRAWKGRRSAILAVVSFVIVLLCFWVIPFLGISVHVYEGM